MRKTSTGSRSGRLALCAAILAAGLWGADKRPKTPSAQAVVAGTVFHENGLSFPGAKVTLTADGDSPQARKFKRIEVVTDQRGEFAIRVKAGQMSYTLTAEADGYQPQSKPVAISADERVDVFFQLAPASKKP